MDKFLERLKAIKIRMPRGITASSVGVRQLVLWGVALLIAIALLFFVRGVTACWQLTALPGVRPATCPGVDPQAGLSETPVVNSQGTPVVPPTPEAAVAAPAVEYPQWDGGSRINIVFFGLRGGDTAGEDCPQCTDTIIVFSIDPVSKTAGMISVPRDLFVNIPGFGYSRINTAWTSGEAAKLPGGGPGLAMRTVSQVLGVPLQYYVQVNFDTFVSFINLIHGIDVYNDENLHLQKLGGGADGIRLTCCGLRHLNGPAALAYARCRKPEQGCNDGDVGRAKRQQKVILAIRDKVLSPTYFPTLMAQAPQLYNIFSAGIRTNISLEDGIKLASLAKDIPFDQIKQGVIDDHMVNYGNVTLGGQNASILMPIPDKIRELRDQIFTSGGALSPIAQGDPRALMQADGARVCVANNSSSAGLDARTGNFLISQGMNVALCGSPVNAGGTFVIIYSPKLYTLRYLMNPLGMITASSQIIFRPDASKGMDMEIHLGDDWVAKLPSGY